ncbi:MAG: hypothetical protein JKY65_07675 [Planctomycetes bacterium]|nr:hypothetical protein [Planctomycetota bacterium]
MTHPTLIRLASAASVVLLLGALGAGCETVEKINGIEYPVEDGPKDDATEVAILAALDEDPENLNAWFALGEHYEKGLRFQDSYSAYGNFQVRLDAQEKKGGLELEQRATVGLDALGRVAIRLGSVGAAYGNSVELLKRQPKSLKAAKHNPHFRIAHLRLAQIHFQREEDEKAHLHAMIHKELGGTRSDGILIGLQEREEKKSRGKNVVRPSHEAGQGESQPAGSRK